MVVGVALALTGLLVYLQFRSSLDSRIDEDLADRQAAVVALARRDRDPHRVVAEAGEPLLQIYRPDGGTILLPPGEFTVEYGRGPEYKLKTQKLKVTTPGKGEQQERQTQRADPQVRRRCGQSLARTS